MQTLLVIGQRGQLARSLLVRETAFAAIGYRVQAIGRPDLDFDRLQTIASAFERSAPSLIVNAAAWTAVDQAETEPDAAMRANCDGPALLARLAEQAGIPIIHLSTDYVFDGTKSVPYIETDPTGPTSVYGQTKLAGENAVLSACSRGIVLRTSWVYSPYGKNFALSMLWAARQKDRLRVVADQFGCPTEAGRLADAILAIAGRVRTQWSPHYGGIFHIAGSGSTSWHGFASAILQAASLHGWPCPPIDPIRTQDWQTPAARPTNSRLDCSKLQRILGIQLPDWKQDLATIIRPLIDSAGAA